MSSARQIGQSARNASQTLATLPASQRAQALETLADLLKEHRDEILLENRKDIESAVTNSLSPSLISRLDLSKPGKYKDMTSGVLDVSHLEDLCGKCTQKRQLDDGLVLRRVMCPIGVILVIFEARPEVIVNITALALKSGNAAILKGGKESTHSFRALSKLVKTALEQSGIPSGAIELVETRGDVASLLEQDEFIDLVIPRGSNALVRQIKESTKIPVMGHADGICHIYVHTDADLEMAIKVIVDSKVDYPAACNAVESLLVHVSLVSSHLPRIMEALHTRNVEFAVESSLLDHLKQNDSIPGIQAIRASDDDFDKEWLCLKLSIRTVGSLPEAIDWINRHSSQHTDCIITDPRSEAATSFQRGVQSSSVFVNASTRFADGMRYGLGTEVGIATGKIHARGPVGLEGLMTYKWLLDGEGQAVGEYKEGGKTYKHIDVPVVREDCL